MPLDSYPLGISNIRITDAKITLANGQTIDAKTVDWDRVNRIIEDDLILMPGPTGMEWQIELQPGAWANWLLLHSWWAILETFYTYALWLGPTMVDLKLIMAEAWRKEGMAGD